jgi:hypothetical protein
MRIEMTGDSFPLLLLVISFAVFAIKPLRSIEAIVIGTLSLLLAHYYPWGQDWYGKYRRVPNGYK